MKPGTIFYHNIYQLSDENNSRKMLVILSDGRQYPNIAVVTSSLPSQARGTESGCQINDRFPSFFLPLHSTYLKEDTWILLDYFAELDPSELAQYNDSGDITRVCELPKNLLKDLLICTISCKDITENQHKELWNTYLNIDSYFE